MVKVKNKDENEYGLSRDQEKLLPPGWYKLLQLELLLIGKKQLENQRLCIPGTTFSKSTNYPK